MSRNTIIVLICHYHKLLDPGNQLFTHLNKHGTLNLPRHYKYSVSFTGSSSDNMQKYSHLNSWPSSIFHECRELDVSAHLCHKCINMSRSCATLNTRNVPGSYFWAINRNNVYISFMNNSNCKSCLCLWNKLDRQVISNGWSAGHKSQSFVYFIHLLLKQIKFNYQSVSRKR
jgi:hypothetical protein